MKKRISKNLRPSLMSCALGFALMASQAVYANPNGNAHGHQGQGNQGQGNAYAYGLCGNGNGSIKFAQQRECAQQAFDNALADIDANVPGTLDTAVTVLGDDFFTVIDESSSVEEIGTTIQGNLNDTAALNNLFDSASQMFDNYQLSTPSASLASVSALSESASLVATSDIADIKTGVDVVLEQDALAIGQQVDALIPNQSEMETVYSGVDVAQLADTETGTKALQASADTLNALDDVTAAKIGLFGVGMAFKASPETGNEFADESANFLGVALMSADPTEVYSAEELASFNYTAENIGISGSSLNIFDTASMSEYLINRPDFPF